MYVNKKIFNEIIEIINPNLKRVKIGSIIKDIIEYFR